MQEWLPGYLQEMYKMKEIVVISGKGGTGKTTVTSSLAFLIENNAIIADCDVDAPDMHIILEPEIIEQNEFYSGFHAEINEKMCISCGKCKDICRFDAIDYKQEVYKINNAECEGCGYCSQICPVEAVKMHESHTGQLFYSQTRFGNNFVHARLNIAAENSGKLVANVRNRAKEEAEKQNKSYVLIDGPPGIGCPVIASITGVNYIVLVTEPSMSALHDLARVVQLIGKFSIPAGCIINKAGMNVQMEDKINTFIKEKNIPLLGKVPFDKEIDIAQSKRKTIAEWNATFKNEFRIILNNIRNLLDK